MCTFMNFTCTKMCNFSNKHHGRHGNKRLGCFTRCEGAQATENRLRAPFMMQQEETMKIIFHVVTSDGPQLAHANRRRRADVADLGQL